MHAKSLCFHSCLCHSESTNKYFLISYYVLGGQQWAKKIRCVICGVHIIARVGDRVTWWLIVPGCPRHQITHPAWGLVLPQGCHCSETLSPMIAHDGPCDSPPPVNGSISCPTEMIKYLSGLSGGCTPSGLVGVVVRSVGHLIPCDKSTVTIQSAQALGFCVCKWPHLAVQGDTHLSSQFLQVWILAPHGWALCSMSHEV